MTYYIKVKQGLLWGLLYKTELVIPCIYDEITPTNTGYFAVKKDGKWGLVDTNGEVKVQLVFDEIAEI